MHTAESSPLAFSYGDPLADRDGLLFSAVLFAKRLRYLDYNLQYVLPADLASFLKIWGTVRAQSLHLVGGAGETFPIKVVLSNTSWVEESYHTVQAKLDLLEGFDSNTELKTKSWTAQIYEHIVFSREPSAWVSFVKKRPSKLHRSAQTQLAKSTPQQHSSKGASAAALFWNARAAFRYVIHFQSYRFR